MHYMLTVTGSNFVMGTSPDAATYLFAANFLTLPVVWRMILVTICIAALAGPICGLTKVGPEISESAGSVYIEVGLTNDVMNGDYQRSSGPPWVGFSIETHIDIWGPDFTSNLVYSEILHLV